MVKTNPMSSLLISAKKGRARNPKTAAKWLGNSLVLFPNSLKHGTIVKILKNSSEEKRTTLRIN
jgi:hypothetical protein